AAHHRERIAVMKIRTAREQRHGLLAGVDEVGVFTSGCGRRPHAEQAVFALQKDLAVLGQLIGHHRRQTDAEVYVRALGNIARNTLCHLIAGKSFHDGSSCQATAALAADSATTRLTNMPGVTITSGSSA